ncbi:MAG: hypothetical protein HOP30_14140 [Cyclobacteriaceae bacterium]|nr:hypothetical protein [Cyclobacteriaceae bacterium]
MYYIIKPAVGTDETGNAYPAVESYPDYDFNASSSVHKLSFHEFPDFNPDIRFKLTKGAKVCDVIAQGAISACGLLVSEKLKKMLEAENLVPHKYCNATIEVNKDKFEPYYWLHFVWPDGIKYLDFKKSKFKIKRASKDLGEIQISNLNDLHSKQGELGFIKMIHNYEYTFLNPNFDLFVHPLNKTIFISEKLKAKMAGFTGIELTLAEHLKVI